MSKKRKEIPRFEKPIIETHCHLDYLKEASIDDIISQSEEYGIEKFITISVTPDNLDTVIDISKQHSNVYCTQGIHPHDAKFWNEEVKNKILFNIKNNKKIVAIGEIGLDFHYNNSLKQQQILAFDDQLEMAVKENLPVVIHSRDADEDTISIMSKHQNNLERKGVIHSFTSGLELAQQAIDWGFYLGFNGIITFKNAENVREALKITPLEQILLETDSPFLAPSPFRGVENSPKYLPCIAEKIAEVKCLPVEEVLEITYQNSQKLFALEHSS